MSDTFVLDMLGFPVAFVPWQRAVNLRWQDRAVVVTEDARRVLRSPSFDMGMPRVIKLRRHISRKLRLRVGVAEYYSGADGAKRGGQQLSCTDSVKMSYTA